MYRHCSGYWGTGPLPCWLGGHVPPVPPWFLRLWNIPASSTWRSFRGRFVPQLKAPRMTSTPQATRAGHINDNNQAEQTKLELYRAHTPRAYCAICYCCCLVVSKAYTCRPREPSVLIAIGLLVISAKTPLTLSLHQMQTRYIQISYILIRWGFAFRVPLALLTTFTSTRYSMLICYAHEQKAHGLYA